MDILSHGSHRKGVSGVEHGMCTVFYLVGCSSRSVYVYNNEELTMFCDMI